MGALDLPGGCGCQTTIAPRCGGDLPDSPACAINYHFGMLLGVEDFRTEQGFHVGRLRRHQRALHGFGIVYGYGVSFDEEHAELRVEAGYAVDAHGRDLEMLAAQCLSLPAWWLKHRDDDEFADVPDKDNVSFDADVMLCYSSCLSRPVPAIADACADGMADIAFSRICESVKIKLVPRRDDAEEPAQLPQDDWHLLRLLLGLDSARVDDDGNTLPDDAWLQQQQTDLGNLPAADRPAAMAALWTAVLARASAASSGPFDAGSDLDDAIVDDCLLLARLSDINIFLDNSDPQEQVWKATVGELDIDQRRTLLPTQVMQGLLQPLPPAEAPLAPAAGPRVVSAQLSGGTTLLLTFDRPLAAASVTAAVFSVSDFDASNGWSLITFAPPAYDNALAVTLTLDQAPAGTLARVTVKGSGSSPLLGADLIPAGAADSSSDGSDLSTTITGA